MVVLLGVFGLSRLPTPAFSNSTSCLSPSEPSRAFTHSHPNPGTPCPLPASCEVLILDTYYFVISDLIILRHVSGDYAKELEKLPSLRLVQLARPVSGSNRFNFQVFKHHRTGFLSRTNLPSLSYLQCYVVSCYGMRLYSFATLTLHCNDFSD